MVEDESHKRYREVMRICLFWTVKWRDNQAGSHSKMARAFMCVIIKINEFRSCAKQITVDNGFTPSIPWISTTKKTFSSEEQLRPSIDSELSARRAFISSLTEKNLGNPKVVAPICRFISLILENERRRWTIVLV